MQYFTLKKAILVLTATSDKEERTQSIVKNGNVKIRQKLDSVFKVIISY